ncbi:MAG TPA: type II toxin-antitoxin system VapC family toxin [Kofleriaceae bacterium]
MLLDTCVVSHHLKGRAPQLSDRVRRILLDEEVRVTEITMYELDRGFQKIEQRGEGRERRRVTSLFLDSAIVYPVASALPVAADRFARAANTKPARIIAELDLLILATAITFRQQLLTSDGPLAEHARAIGMETFVEHHPVA